MGERDRSTRKLIDPAEELQVWRKDLIRNVFRAAVLFGAIAVVVGAFATRNRWLTPFYIGLYATFILVTFWQRGSYPLQAWGTIGLLYGMGVLALFEDGLGGDGRVFMLVLPVVALLLLGRRVGLYALALGVLTLGGFGVAFSTGLLSIPAQDQLIAADWLSWLSASLVFLMLAGTIVVSLNYLLRHLRNALDQSYQLTQDLDAHKANLEEQVAERTHKLTERTQELDRMVATQHDLLETIRRMSTPVVPVLEGVIVMPLVGVIDQERAQQITKQLLAGIEVHGARVALIDVTGVPVIDATVAHHLMKAVQAAQLLGTEPILVGMRPEMAETIVSLGLDLRDLVSYSDLQQGIARALRRSRDAE